MLCYGYSQGRGYCTTNHCVMFAGRECCTTSHGQGDRLRDQEMPGVEGEAGERGREVEKDKGEDRGFRGAETGSKERRRRLCGDHE